VGAEGYIDGLDEGVGLGVGLALFAGWEGLLEPVEH